METDAIFEEQYKGFTIKILQDSLDDSPRNWDNAGKMVTWHRRYSLGDEQPRIDPEEWLADLLRHEVEWDSKAYYEIDDLTIPELLERLAKYYIFLPLFLYDHSGISISTSTFQGRAIHAEWDSGQIGWIYISKKDAVKEWGKRLFTKDVEQRATNYLVGEVETYNDFLTGNVYGYVVERDGEDVDSCWGYYPDHDPQHAKDPDYREALNEARSIADFEADKLTNELAIAAATGEVQP
jgi:hypothetical protein